MEASVFEILEAEDRAEQERVSGSRAIIAAQQRVANQFGKFLANSRTPLELEARVALVDSQVWQIVADTCSEHECDDHQKVYTAATSVLAGGHASDCECGFCANKGKLPGAKKDEDGDEDEGVDEPEHHEAAAADPHERKCDGCSECADGEHCRSCPANDSPGSIEPKEAIYQGNPNPPAGSQELAEQHAHQRSLLQGPAGGADWAQGGSGDWMSCPSCGGSDADPRTGACLSCGTPFHTARTAAGEPEDYDTYWQERVDLPKSDGTGLGGPSPKIDKSRPAGDAVDGTHLKPIDVPSNKFPSEQQAVPDPAEYNSADNWDGRGEGPITTQDASKAMDQGTAPHTDTWTGTGGLADPVTNESLNSFTSKWRVIGL